MTVDIKIDTNLFLLLIGILGASFAFQQINLYSRYERKIIQIKNALIGLIWNAKKEIVEWDLINKTENNENEPIQKHLYGEFLNIIVKSNLVKYGSYYEKMINYQIYLEKDLDKLTIFILILIIPVCIIAFPEIPPIFGNLIFYIDVMFILLTTAEMYQKIRLINRLYSEYVLEGSLFGGYY